MYAVHASELRKNLAATLDRVADNAEPALITRSGGAAAVLLDINEYNALAETAYLLASPANAARLAKGVADVAAGRTAVRGLAE